LNFSYRSFKKNLIVSKLAIVNSQFTKLPTVWFKKPNLAVMHACSYCKHAYFKLLIDDNDDQIFCVLSLGPAMHDGTHINEEQNQNHEMSTGYRPKPGTSHIY